MQPLPLGLLVSIAILAIAATALVATIDVPPILIVIVIVAGVVCCVEYYVRYRQLK
jgi:hypothetical protein